LEEASCEISVGGSAGISTLIWDFCELAAFFKDIIIRLIIIGINLSRPKSVSYGSVSVRTRGISHRVSPADRIKRRVISEERFEPKARVGTAYTIGKPRIAG